MTLVKRPTLERQRTILRVEPRVSLAEGVRWVCAHQRRLVANEGVARGPVMTIPHPDGARSLASPKEVFLTPARSQVRPLNSGESRLLTEVKRGA